MIYILLKPDGQQMSFNSFSLESLQILKGKHISLHQRMFYYSHLFHQDLIVNLGVERNGIY